MAKYYSENDAQEILDAEWKSTSVGILIFIFYTPNWQHDSCVQKVTEIKSTLLPRFFHFYKYHEIIRLVCTYVLQNHVELSTENCQLFC